MKFSDFKQSLRQSEPPPDLPPLAEALWWDAHGNWSRAHEIAQDVHSPDGAWVHAYLHRKEGDASNAGYWYRQAGKPHARQPLEAEWEQILTVLLGDSAHSG